VRDADGPLVVGFRPDHLRAGEDGEGLEIEARVEVVEWLGADVFVHFDVDLQGFEMQLPEDLGAGADNLRVRSVVGRVGPGAGVREGDVVRFRLNPHDVQVFDGGSGENLTITDPDLEDVAAS
jgi:multiple sugar transport system ATP-binding protein